ncbi:MAG: hypothetical protein V7K67_14105 [Nostoc sp.]|uniref:hypothetical protein n=1 Tax=Nostoc sp. TaxID=1180 RepID=UPI002FF22624
MQKKNSAFRLYAIVMSVLDSTVIAINTKHFVAKFRQCSEKNSINTIEEGIYAEGRRQKEQLNGDSDPNEKVSAV